MGFWHRLGRFVGRRADLDRVPDGLECEILEDVLPTEEVPVNDQQFGGGWRYERGPDGSARAVPQAYHAVVGKDGMFHAEPLVPGTVVNTAAGGMRMYDGLGWKPVPDGLGKMTSAELEKLMKPSPEAVEAISKALDEDIKKAMEPKFKFRPF